MPPPMQPQLEPGECAVVYYKATDPDEIGIVLFDHLFPGDTIYITDNSILGGCSEHCRWASDGYCDDGGPGFQYADCVSGTDCTDCGPRPVTRFATTEGHMMYTAPTSRGPGTVLTLSNFSAAPGAQAIALSGGGGDELIVYRIGLGQTRATPTFLCGLCSKSAAVIVTAHPCGFDNIPGISSYPPGVWNYFHPTTFTGGDWSLWIYNAGATGLGGFPTSGSRAELLAAIGNRTNWFFSNTLSIPIQDVVPAGGYRITNLPPSMPPPSPMIPMPKAPPQPPAPPTPPP